MIISVENKRTHDGFPFTDVKHIDAVGWPMYSRLLGHLTKKEAQQTILAFRKSDTERRLGEGA